MNRIGAIIKDPSFTAAVDKIAEMEKERRFCRHTFQHFIDVARIAYILMLESGDIRRFMVEFELTLPNAREILYAAALLHDIGRWKEYETGEDHSIISAELAGDILIRAGFNAREIGIIRAGIREHRHFTENMSLLGEHLYRADDLARFCTGCDVKGECHKYEKMETGRNMILY